MKKFISIFYLIILITPCFARDNYGKILKIDESHKYLFSGYNIYKDSFFICLENKQTHKINFYQFKDNLLFEAKNDINNEYDLTMNYNNSGEKFKKHIFPNNKIIKEYCVGGLQYSESEFIICLKKAYLRPELYLFNGNKFNKLELENVSPIVGYGNASFFYDKQYDKLYFTGEKIIFSKIESIVNGLFVYDFQTKKQKLLQKAYEGHELVAPFRIPGTEKLIYFNIISYETEGIQEIYMRDIEK
jgi:hypothetical protein